MAAGLLLLPLMESEIKELAGENLVNLQMVLASSSMNHEYVRQAYDRTHSFARKQELLIEMSNLKNLYFAARNKLALHHPERLDAIERELKFQKQTVLSETGIH